MGGSKLFYNECRDYSNIEDKDVLVHVIPILNRCDSSNSQGEWEQNETAHKLTRLKFTLETLL